MRWDALGCAGMRWDALGCAGMRWDALGCAGMRWDVLGVCGVFSCRVDYLSREHRERVNLYVIVCL